MKQSGPFAVSSDEGSEVFSVYALTGLFREVDFVVRVGEALFCSLLGSPLARRKPFAIIF